MGLYWRGRKNAEQIQIRHNHIGMRTLPNRFDGFTLLHISDLHADMNEGAMRRLTELLPDITYDVCVLTGDYRGPTFGPFDAALESLARVRSHLKGPLYGVLGNHDTIRMVPELEEMGIRILLNECEAISRGHEAIYLAGIDDAHYYRVDNIEKGSIRHSRQRVLYPPFAYAGNLPPGRICRFRSASERPYPRGSDRLPGSFRLPLIGSATAYGLGAVEIRRHDGLHLGGCRMLLSFPSGLIVFRKLRYIASNVFDRKIGHRGR